MKAFLVLSVVIVAAVAAPVEDVRNIGLEKTQREKKSPKFAQFSIQAPSQSYGPAPAAPCSGAPANLAPVTLYAIAPQAASAPLYREDEHEHMEHLARADEHARSYYDSPAAASAAIAANAAAAAAASASAAASAPAAPAVGIFPNAKVGGCALPLLLSCAPKVVSGHMAHAAPSYAASSYGAPAAMASPQAALAPAPAQLAPPSAYRAPETNQHQHSMRDASTMNVNLNTNQNTNLNANQRAAHISEHALHS